MDDNFYDYLNAQDSYAVNPTFNLSAGEYPSFNETYYGDDEDIFPEYYQDKYSVSADPAIAANPQLQEALRFVTDLTESGEAQPFDNFSRLGDKLFGAVSSSIVAVASALGRREAERIAPLQQVAPQGFNWFPILLAIAALGGLAFFMTRR